MPLFHDIRSQPKHVRHIMFILSVMTAVSLVGVIWYGSFEHDLYVLLNSEKEYQEKFLAVKEQVQEPTLMAYIGESFQALQAGIYGLLNLQSDTPDAKNKGESKVHLLPLSGER